MSTEPELADRLALALLVHGPLSTDRLARNVRARKADVVLELRSNALFEPFGAGRSSRWRLERPPSPRDQQGTDSPTGSYTEHALQITRRLRALERRVAELERHLADRDES
jgi:hypothetical protein